MKIDKYISLSCFISRRKANELIDKKKISVNGIIAKYSYEVKESDIVLLDGKQLTIKKHEPTYIVYNKPKGIICTSEKIEGNIIDAIGHEQNIYPVGRLDKDSEGLILLTNHSEIIDKIANAEFGHEKEYVVTLNLPVRKQFLKEIEEGIILKGEKIKTKPCITTLEPNTKRVFRIILTQGINRQIRRMCNAFDYQVIKLQRVRVMHINLEKLKPGEWRNLNEVELKALLELLKN